MPGLSRIARKLNIDCAQAMVGWEFRKGRNVPMLDGWIVCEEHVDIFQAAWDEEQVNIMKREQEVYLILNLDSVFFISDLLSVCGQFEVQFSRINS